MQRSTPRSFAPLALLALAALLLPSLAHAQPFGSWTLWSRPASGYIEIPHSAALNPTSQITIEGWVDVSDAGGCSNIIGKGYTTAWWIGLCGNTLRSYLHGLGSAFDAGNIGEVGWHHFAVTYNGVQRCHYIDGVLAACVNDAVPPSANTRPVRIGSDVDYSNFSPAGAINEIRLWNVARSLGQIRSTINVPLTSPQAGLVAVWANGSQFDAVGPHDGSVVGIVPALTFPVTALPCATTATTLCAHDRFNASVRWKTGTDSGVGTLVLASEQSGVYWFFNFSNWELMVKILNGCPLNNRWWVFTAATTNVFYRLEVFDQLAGVNKVYFNYAGPPAPAVTDTNAFATCP